MLDYKKDDIFNLVSKGDVEAIKKLPASSYFLQNEEGETPLMVAIMYNFKKVVDLFLSAEDLSFLHILNNDGENALFYALLVKNEELAFKLIEKGLNIFHISKSGNTTLHYSVMAGFYDLSIELIIRGVDVNKKNELGFSPLTIAVLLKNWKLVETLLLFGADKNSIDLYGLNPVDWAHSLRYFALASFIKNFGEVKEQ